MAAHRLKALWTCVVCMSLLWGQCAQASPTLVINAETGDVLHSEEALKSWHPASLTKLMTAYITFQAIASGKVKPTTYIKISANAAAQKPSKLGLKAGSSITVEAALHALITKSANDIAYALAEGIGGNTPTFVNWMNREAQALGMDGTRFVNPNGLPNPLQVTTARDMAILAKAILRDFPQYEGFFRVPGLQIGNKTLRSYNALIGRYPGADGMKTGFVCASGFNLVASASRGGKRYIAVVLGETGGQRRAERAAELLDAAFDGTIQGSGYLITSLRNLKDQPTSMQDVVCGPNRIHQAAESDETALNEYVPGGEPSESNGFGMYINGVQSTQQSRLAPKPATIPTVAIAIEGPQKGTQIAYIDRGNGRPPLPAGADTPIAEKPAVQKNTKIEQKPLKFMPAHPPGNERIEFHGRPKIIAPSPIQLRPVEAEQ